MQNVSYYSIYVLGLAMVVAMFRFGCKSNIWCKASIIFCLVATLLVKLVIIAMGIQICTDDANVKEYTFGGLFWLDMAVIGVCTICITVHAAK